MERLDPGLSRWLRAYGWIFLGAGAVFVLLPGPLMSGINLPAAWLPGARPLPGELRTLWLGLAGSMMAMIAYLSFALARDCSQSIAWDTLLLSKGVSTVLFTASAVADANSLFLTGALVDGTIFLHLFALRLRAEQSVGAAVLDGWRPRLGVASGRGYEVWFIKLNDPKTRNALWVRYTLSRRSGGVEAACWYVLFDAARKKMLQGRWEEPAAAAVLGGPGRFFRLGESSIGRDGAVGKGAEASWNLAWEAGPSPVFSFVPEALHRLGVAGTVYCTPLSFGRFEGGIKAGGTSYVFSQAPGCLGHLWGARMGDNWRWAHAIFPGREAGDETVFEILSAQARIGPLKTPVVTVVHLWHRGRHYRSTGLLRAMRNSTTSSTEGWTFRADLGELRAEGECRPAPGMTADVIYTDTDGRKLLCRNSKTGFMRLRLKTPDGRIKAEFETEDSAAVETVRGCE